MSIIAFLVCSLIMVDMCATLEQLIIKFSIKNVEGIKRKAIEYSGMGKL